MLLDGYPPMLSPSPVSGSEVNVKSVPVDSNIIRSSSRSPEPNVYPRSSPFFDLPVVISNPQSPWPLKSTSGKKKPGLLALNSSSERKVLSETLQLIGNVLSNLPRVELTMKYLPIYLSVVTTRYAPSLPNIQSLILSNERVLFFGVKLVQEKVVVPGMKPVSTLIVKIPAQSGGAVTVVKRMLLSMNFAEQLMFHTYLDGSIVIQSEWKPKDLPSLCQPSKSGSRPTSVPMTGIQS